VKILLEQPDTYRGGKIDKKITPVVRILLLPAAGIKSLQKNRSQKRRHRESVDLINTVEIIPIITGECVVSELNRGFHACFLVRITG